MRYMLLIYDDEKVWARMSKAEVDRTMGAYFGYTEELKKNRWNASWWRRPATPAITSACVTACGPLVSAQPAKTTTKLAKAGLVNAGRTTSSAATNVRRAS
jgi:hypothetical protein